MSGIDFYFLGGNKNSSYRAKPEEEDYSQKTHAWVCNALDLSLTE